MLKSILRNLLILCSLVFFVVFHANSQLADSAEARIKRNFELVRENFSGQEALNTVTFVEKYWRLAGNSGFNASIDYVVNLLQQAGYVEEDMANESGILTYRLETRPMDELTWDPQDASLEIIGEEGAVKVLDFSTNRNMIAINSFSTPEEGIEAELVYLEPGMSNDEIEALDVRGKVVFAERHPYRLFNSLVRDKGALGLIIYSNPDYVQPEKYRNSIQFTSIPQDSVLRSWTIVTSYQAKEKLINELKRGPVKVRVKIKTRLYESEELTIVADVRGSKYPEERIVYSAHVQEPGANDNASGVGAQAEMAIAIAKLIQGGEFTPDRTITFLFGDEIISTRRYITEDKTRAKGIKWGISLDMVGENTEITGGTFLIEKIPDPSAVWTRGKDKHTEWGGSPLSKDQIVPNYFNDFIIDIFEQQGEFANWTVNTNPFEGGSDHVPFLRANIPGLLLWHFTDAFYHTDGDRIDKVSMGTLQNVGTGALVAGMTLVNSDEALAEYILSLLESKGSARLMAEFELGRRSISDGGDKTEEEEIIKTWATYYKNSIGSIRQLVNPDDLSTEMEEKIRLSEKRIDERGKKLIRRLSL